MSKKQKFPDKVTITPRVKHAFTRLKNGRKKRRFFPRNVTVTPKVTKFLGKGRLTKQKLRYDPPLTLDPAVDPRKVYEARAILFASNSKPGIERFAYMVFGPSFMGSLALALNPYSKIEFPTAKITPANRTTRLQCIPFTRRYNHSVQYNELCANNGDSTTLDLSDRTPIECTRTLASDSLTEVQIQEAIFGSRSDTTVRTRPAGSKFGEFELFVPRFYAPARFTFNRGVIKSSWVVPPGGAKYTEVTNSDNKQTVSGVGPGFYITKSSVDILKANEMAFCTLQMVKNGLTLVNKCLPTAKKFQLAYNISELKDLPMMLRKSVELLRDPSIVLDFKGGGDTYLNYKFGWESTVRSIRDMLSLPTKIADHVNYLIKRRGMATNYRSLMKGVGGLESTPLFDFNPGPGEAYRGYGSFGHREWELRCALNLTTHFPEVEVPELRKDLLDKAWGSKLTPSDIYNLVPWTWLVDWFSGIGQYVQIMDTLYSDKSTFNYGFLTYSCKGHVSGSAEIETHTYRSTITGPPYDSKSEDILHKWNPGAALDYRYQKRIDISTLAHVKTLSRPSTLGAGQLAILGALLTKFIHS